MKLPDSPYILSNNFHKIPIAQAIVTGTGLMVDFANEHMQEITGGAIKTGYALFQTLPLSHNKVLSLAIHEAFHNGKPQYIRFFEIFLSENDHSIPTDIHISPLKNQEGNTYGIMLTVNEIADSTLQGTMMLESYHTFEQTIMNLPFATAIYMGSDMTIKMMNQEMLLLMRKDSSIINKPLSLAIPNISEHPFFKILYEVYHTGVSYQAEEVKFDIPVNNLIRPYYFNISCKPLVNFQQKISGVLHTAQDITAQVNTKLELKNTRENIEFALEAADMATWVMFPKLNLVETDSRFKKVFGIPGAGYKTFEEILGYVYPEDQAIFINQLQKVTKVPQQTEYKLEFRIIMPDHSLRWLRSRGKITVDANGEALSIAGILVDISTEKLKEEALKVEEKKFSTAFENTSVGMVMLDLNGNIIETNTCFSEIIGYSKEELLHVNFKDITYPEDVKNHIALIEKLQNKEIPSFVIEKRYVRKDGSILWARLTSSLLYKEYNQANTIISILQDITKEVFAVKRLKSTIEELNNLIKQFTFVTDFMPQIVWATHPDGSKDFYNRRWYEYTRLPKDNTDQGWFSVLHPEDAENSDIRWKESLQTGMPYECEYRLRRYDGKYRWFLSRALPLRNESGTIIKWFGTCTDIHEQKLLEFEKDNFFGIASHELKTPVTSIKAYTQVLENMLLHKGFNKEAGMVSKMDAQINRLTNLIRDLLDVTRINAGKMEFNYSYFNLNQLIGEIIEEIQRTTNKHHIILNLSALPEIYSDRDRIGQVVTNLLTNAIKYSPNADEVIVNTQLKNNEVFLCVEDFGVGISSENQEKVFDRFFRVKNGKKHTFPGLGLGLYISAEIIKREGGRIWIEKSAEDEGSTFCVSLPLKKPKEEINPL
jgi:PAS domain S-box-containing protein